MVFEQPLRTNTIVRSVQLAACSETAGQHWLAADFNGSACTPKFSLTCEAAAPTSTPKGAIESSRSVSFRAATVISAH